MTNKALNDQLTMTNDQQGIKLFNNYRRRRYHVGIWTLVIGILFGFCILSFGSPASAGVGGSGANFLLLGGGARALGMGEAYVALADDSSSIFWNPAGLAKMHFPEVLYMYNEWFIDIRHQYLDFAYPMEFGVLGGSFSLLDSGDIQGYDSGGVRTSTIRATDSGLTLSWAQKIKEKLSVGVGIKYISETLEKYTASSTALDLGVIYDLTHKLSVGGAIQNVGTPLKFIEEETPLPQTFRLGWAFRDRIMQDRVNLAFDYVKSGGAAPSFNLGGEYVFRDYFAIRAGSTGRGFRAGLGIKAALFGLDYAYLSHGDLGAAHQISMTVTFGTREEREAQILDHLALGKAYYDQRRFSEAVLEFRKVLALDPEHAEARLMLTKANRALEEKVVEKVEKEIMVEKEEEVKKYIAAGKKFMDEKEYLESIAELNKALKIIPSHPDAIKLLKEAQAALEKEVMAKVKREAQLHLGQALKYITTEDYAEALIEVEKALEIDPGNVQALRLYKKLRKILELEKR